MSTPTPPFPPPETLFPGLENFGIDVSENRVGSRAPAPADGTGDPGLIFDLQHTLFATADGQGSPTQRTLGGDVILAQGHVGGPEPTAGPTPSTLAENNAPHVSTNQLENRDLREAVDGLQLEIDCLRRENRQIRVEFQERLRVVMETTQQQAMVITRLLALQEEANQQP